MTHNETDHTFATGCVTLPTETGKESETFDLVRRWGVDAIRDSDGIGLPEELINSGCQIYSTICLVRADQEWAQAHPEQLAQKYLMSAPVTATGDQIEISTKRSCHPHPTSLPSLSRVPIRTPRP